MFLFQRLAIVSIGLYYFSSSVVANSRSRNPLNYLSLIEQPEIQTPSRRVHALSHFDLVFNLHQNQQRIKLTLEPNHDILADGAAVQYLDVNGEVLRTEPIERDAHKVFKGSAWIQEDDGSWSSVGWARIVIRRDGIDPLFEGAFTIMHDHHHIQFRSNYMQTKHELDPHVDYSDDEYMIIFRDSDIGHTIHEEFKRSDAVESICRADQSAFNSDLNHPIFSTALKRDVGFWGAMPMNSLFGKRQIDTNGIPNGGGNSGGVNLKSTIGSTAGCPSTRKVALVGVATDCTYTGSFNSTDSVRHNVITQINSASDLYERTFNITLGLQNLTVSDSNCPGTPAAATPWNVGCSGNTTISDRLNTFSQWRGDRNDANAYWTLLTTCATGAEVGLAWLGQACVTQVNKAQTTDGSSETVSGANVVARTSTEWQVIAHESGHTFGAVHDCNSATCADGNTVNAQQCCPLSASTCDAGSQYIMNPATGRGITQFSPCSIGNICSAIGRNSVKTSCLSPNKGVTTISGNQCGNGIVEPGEDCDCGGVSSCGNNQCCDPTTCKFKNKAVCDDANEGCCRDCQFASSNTVCRASTGECDPQEVCSGKDPLCPADQTAPDGQSCGNGSLKLQCASGQCTSRDLQCKTLMGSYTQNNDTYACNSESCSLTCASPEFGPGTCYSMQQNFLDGTNCGGGGRCVNGQCKGSSTVKEVGSWINDNKPLVIGVCCALGGIILLMLLGCIVRRCRRSRRQPKRRTASRPQQAWYPPPPPPPPMRSNGHTGGWGGGSGPYWQHQPPMPPPTYYQPSVRYA